MNKPQLSPKGEAFYDKYNGLVDDIVSAFAEIAEQHDKHSYSLLINCFTQAAIQAHTYIDATDHVYEGAARC